MKLSDIKEKIMKGEKTEIDKQKKWKNYLGETTVRDYLNNGGSIKELNEELLKIKNFNGWLIPEREDL